MDITMTAVLRPNVLKTTLNSFKKNLFIDFSNYRLIVNIDPVGEAVTYSDVLDVIYEFFPSSNVIYNTPDVPHFGKAAMWCWNRVESNYIFHLEDDWKLIHKINMNDLINVIDNNKEIGTMRLLVRKYKDCFYRKNEKEYYLLTNTLSLNPCLFRKIYLDGLIKKMNIEKNPELQVVSAKEGSELRDYDNKWKHAVYNHKDNPLIENIGIKWRDNNNLKKPKSSFVVWTKK